MKVFIEGVACCYKSSAVRALMQSGMNNAYLCDLTENLSIKPSTLTLIRAVDEQVFNLIYLASTCNRDFFKDGIFDRSPITPILYYMVHHWEQTKDHSLFKNVIIDYLKNVLPSDSTGIIVVPQIGQEKKVLQKMNERKNGLDIMTIQYVLIQREIFVLVAEALNWPLITIDIENPTKSVKKITRAARYLYEPILIATKDLRPAFALDAGLDLSTSRRYELKAGVPTKIDLKERIMVPTNCFGQLVTRSSTALIGQVRSGAPIDPCFNGQLSFVFVADQDMVVYENDKLVQFILLEKVQNFKRFLLAAEDMPCIGRGNKSFGSTGHETRMTAIDEFETIL